MDYRTVETDRELLRRHLLSRDPDSHKGDFGHALLVCGCERMPGAAVLATGAALESGCGLVTLRSTSRACTAAVNSFPSAMLSEDVADVISDIPRDMSRYNAIGVGPGLGKDPRTVGALRLLMEEAGERSMVLDADALNIISENPELRGLIPPRSVLTPHMGELKRLLGTQEPAGSDIVALCEKTRSAVVVKGYHTRIYVPDGTVYVNTTGNPGMAKGGSGDVLTGLVTGLIARGYQWYEAAVLGVWLHGYAGDVLTAERTAECFSSRDLLDVMYRGFKALYQPEAD